jgi:helix-turn-helix protein
MRSNDQRERAGRELAALRAVAHPVRRHIIDLLGEHTTLTATECARLLGLSAKVCSYHLGQLAGEGWVEEVPAPGRNRPWRLSAERAAEPTAVAGPAGPGPTLPGLSEAGGARRPDPAQAAAASDGPVRAAFHARQRARAARVRHDDELLADAADALADAAGQPTWAATATVHSRIATMTAPEVAAWVEDVERITTRHVRRAGQDPLFGDVAERVSVRLTFFGYPETAGT